MAKQMRSYSQKTIKVLFARSGNKCAFPDCSNPIVVDETDVSDSAVLGQICHIYAASDNGPRGKPDLKESERNVPENLILLCGHHHPLVDEQWETYPASMLIEWKRKNEATFSPQTHEAVVFQRGVDQAAFAQASADEEATGLLEAIRKNRFFVGFEASDAARNLSARLRFDLAGCSPAVKARIFAWCARWLSKVDQATANGLLQESRTFGRVEEGDIAEAFLDFPTDRNRALSKLASVGTPAARTAALQLIAFDNDYDAIRAWLSGSGLTALDFDSDGKFVYLAKSLEAGDESRIDETLGLLTDDDFRSTPALWLAAAQALLQRSVPTDARSFVLQQIPLEAESFPLSSDARNIADRHVAIRYFDAISAYTASCGLERLALIFADYALWLELRDPELRNQALEKLQCSMQDPTMALRRVNFALRFGVKCDLAAIEREIDRRVILSGGGGAEEAYARLAIAFAKGDHAYVAAYLAAHRSQLHKNLNKDVIRHFETQVLARGGAISAAQAILDEAKAEDSDPETIERLQQIIADAMATDPAKEKRQRYEKTGKLEDLVNLTVHLEELNLWQELVPFALRQYEITHSLEDLSLTCRALNETAQYTQLHELLSSSQAVLSQSNILKRLWAWSLYRMGELAHATTILDDLLRTTPQTSDRHLQVNIAITSGNWRSLLTYCEEEWNSREARDAKELLIAGQIGQFVQSPYAKDLVKEAVRKAPDDAGLLAAAYLIATQGGWDQTQEIAQWLTRAAEMSGDDGPIRQVSIAEIVDEKPNWDAKVTETSERLHRGEIPIAVAGYLLNRSLLDLMLAPSFANMDEADPRRRSIVYAFSAADHPYKGTRPSSIALDLTAIFTLARLGLLRQIIGYYQNITISHSTLGWLFRERQKAVFHQPSRIEDAHLLKRLLATGAVYLAPKPTKSDPELQRDLGNDLADLLSAALELGGGDLGHYVVRPSPVHRVGTLTSEEADLSDYTGTLCGCAQVIHALRARGVLTSSEVNYALSYLKLHERPWASEPEIADKSHLYLDDLAVSYFTTTDILDRLKNAGFTVYVTEHANNEADQLIAMEHLGERQLKTIEEIRETIFQAIQQGTFRVAPIKGQVAEESIKSLPAVNTLDVGVSVDALVIDDRSLNRHANLDVDGKLIPILSTLDLLDDLLSSERIDETTYFEKRVALRQMGFQFVPIRENELLHHLRAAPLRRGHIVETAELRAIRHSLLKARMSKFLRMPEELHGLVSSTNAISETLRTLWKTEHDKEKVKAYCSWLLQLLDIRGFAASLTPGNTTGFSIFAQAAIFMQASIPPTGCPIEVTREYLAWIDEKLVGLVKLYQPEAFAWMTGRARELIAEADQLAMEGQDSDEE